MARSKATSAVTQEQMKAVLDATADYALENSGVQRHARCLWILSGRGMGVCVRE